MKDRFQNGLHLADLLGIQYGLLDSSQLVQDDEIPTPHHSGFDHPISAQLAGLISMVTQFQVSERISIVWKPGDLWSVVDSGLVLNIDGEWEYEPTGSNRSTEFKVRTRFSFKDAFERANRVTTNQRP